MPTRRDFLTLAGLAACSGCSLGSSGGTGWSGRELEMMRASLGSNRAKGWAAWQGNREVGSWNPAARGPALSITKAIAALAATRAAGEGWLSPEERVCDTVSEWRGDPWKSGITVRMLLQQVSGLEAGVIPLYRNQPPDKGRSAVALRCVDAPGTVFRYGPGHWETLAEVMRRKLSRRGEPLAAFMARTVMHPVGLNRHNWRSDKLETPYFSTGTELSVAELGRLGRTIGRLLAGQDTDGFSARHFVEMTSPSRVNPMFGGGLWRNNRVGRPGAAAIAVERSIDDPMPAAFWGGACLSARQPGELVALVGSGGKRVYVWPSSGRCVARIGASTSWSDAAFLGSLRA